MNTKDKINLFLLICFYCFLVVANIRYFPGDLARTVLETAMNVLTLASAAVGFTVVIVSVMQKMVGQRLPWDRVLRFYLFFGIMIWMFAIMYTHFDQIEREKQAEQVSSSKAETVIEFLNRNEDPLYTQS